MNKFIIAMLVSVFALLSAEKTHAIARYGKPEYGREMTGFSFVNPHAPKKGTLRLSTVGTFDSIHPYTVTGTKAEGLLMCFDPLTFRNPQEPFTLYGCIAEAIEIGENNSSVTFYLNPKAKFSDDHAITAEDVKFTYEYLREEGLPRHKHFYSKIEKIEIIDKHTIKLTFKKEEDGNYNAEFPFNMSLLLVLPKHYLEGKKFEEVDFEKIPTSGAYKISKFELGKFIEFERRLDHWANNLPIYSGMNNFESIKIDYYKTVQAQFLAFQAGEFDVFFETNPNAWESAYDFQALKSEQVKKVDIAHERPVAVRTIIFNMKQPIFNDWKVRKAISYAIDFDTINKMLFAGSMQPADSMFANTFLSGAKDKRATPAEEKILSEFKDQIPGELYTSMIETGFIPARTKGDGDQRDNLEKASKLLDEAGWRVEKGVRQNSKCEKLKIEFLYKDPKLEKIALSLKGSLEKIGIELVVKMSDSAQYETCVRERKFDMIVHTWMNSLSPGNEQTIYFSRKMADTEGSSNYMGLKDEIAEKLASRVANTFSIEELSSIVHAFDRYVMNMHYQIPLSYDNRTRFAYWADKVAFPELDKRVGLNVIAFGWQPEEAVVDRVAIEQLSIFERIKVFFSRLFSSN